MSEAIQIRSTDGGGAVCLHLEGVIDERFEAASLHDKLLPVTILDLDGIKRITSFGVRQWGEAMKTLPAQVRHLYLFRCPPCVVDQLNMVINFGGRAEVLTVSAIYYCESCKDERTVQMDVLGNRDQITSQQAIEARCPVCLAPLRFEEDPQQFFRFVATYGAKAIEPVAQELLERTGLYRVRAVGRAPEEVKLVHGEVTLFRLSGMLDERFRPRRLASGVEGNVVFDLGEVEGCDATGAERWQTLIAALSAASSIVLVDLPGPLLKDAAEGRFSLTGSFLHSVRANYRCAVCGHVTVLQLRAAELAEAATRPCGRCGQPSQLSTDRALLAAVFGRSLKESGAPASVEAVIAQRQELLERAQAESNRGPRAEAGGAEALSRYRVIRPLTHGGMAEILLAVHQGIGGFEKLIVLKKIRREILEKRQIAIELFLNEAKIAANLSHPNIVQIFEIGEQGGDLFIAMEYVHGVDARDVIKEGLARESGLSLAQILFVGQQVAAALNHAHNARDLSGRKLDIVHRDVSLSNIVISFDGQVKLVDFGIATASVVDISQEGLIGKCSYMSPEQIRHDPLDGRSDVFSLGIVLYELIAGRSLFRRSSDELTMRAVLQDEIPSLADKKVPLFVEQALRKALARRREDRFPDARSFELALGECQQRLDSSVGSHQLALYMKGLYGDRGRTPSIEEVANQPVPLGRDGGDSQSRSYRAQSPPWEAETKDSAPSLVEGRPTSPLRPIKIAASKDTRDDATPTVGRPRAEALSAAERAEVTSPRKARSGGEAGERGRLEALAPSPARSGRLSPFVMIGLVCLGIALAILFLRAR